MGDSRSRICELVFLIKKLSIYEIIRVRHTSRASPMCGGDDDSESLNLEDKTIKKDKA